MASIGGITNIVHRSGRTDVASTHAGAKAERHRGIAVDSSDDDSDEEVGAQAPPLTKQISNILHRYPEGGQILKVCCECRC